MTPEITLHPFERSLGAGPYRLVGFFDLGACIAALNAGNVDGHNNGLARLNSMGLKSGGGTCSHCGHAILNIYVVSNGAGERYGVGSDCVAQVGKAWSKKDASTYKLLRDIRDQKTAARNAAADLRIKAALAAWKPFSEDALDTKIKTTLSPASYSWHEFVYRRGGRSGQLKVARMVEQAQVTAKEA